MVDYQTEISPDLCSYTMMPSTSGVAVRQAEREKMVVVFITKQIIKLHLDYYIHKAASILQIGKKRAKLPWMIVVRRFAFTISSIIERHLAVRECTDGDASV
jgi:hypothetical protein